MANEIEVGAILEGKVTGITKFGAFVSLPGGKSGLVHISEIAYSYVSDVNDHLSEGQGDQHRRKQPHQPFYQAGAAPSGASRLPQ